MANFFGEGFFGGKALTPAQLKELAELQKSGALRGAVEGEYMPREGGVTRGALSGFLESDPVSTQTGRPEIGQEPKRIGREGEYQARGQGIEQGRPRIGVDPVSSQQQSRVGPDRAGRTFYANTAGDVGTSVPKGGGTSGVYDEAAGAAGKVGGVFGKLARVGGKLLGPLGFVADAVNPEAVADGELTPEQQAQQAQLAVANMGPQMAGDAWQFGSDVAKRTLDAGMQRKAPLDLRDPQQARGNYFNQDMSPRLEETPVGPVAEANPQTPQAAVGAAEQQKVGMQQQVADQSLNALNSGQLTRTAAAETVVKADQARTGKSLTPDQQQAAVKEEVANMKTMDNQGLSKYLGIALVAGGLLASVLDKSGKTTELFVGSMNKQMDRELASGQAQRKADAAAAKAKQDMKLELLKLEETKNRNQTYAKSVDNTGEYQEAQVGLGAERNDISREGQASTNAYRGAALGLRAQGLTLQQQKMAQDTEQFQAAQGLRERQLTATERNIDSQIERRGEQSVNDRTSNLLRARGVAAKEKGNLPKLSTKEAEALVEETYAGQGVKLNGAARAAMAQQLRRNASQDPAFFDNPSAAALRLGDQAQYETGTRGGIGYLPGITNTETRVKKRKASTQ